MATEQERYYSEEEEAFSARLARRARDAPYLFVGLAGLVGSVGYGAYRYKQGRIGNVPLSLFIMQFRVFSQGAVIACLTAGMTYHMVKDYVFKAKKLE